MQTLKNKILIKLIFIIIVVKSQYKAADEEAAIFTRCKSNIQI